MTSFVPAVTHLGIDVTTRPNNPNDHGETHNFINYPIITDTDLPQTMKVLRQALSVMGWFRGQSLFNGLFEASLHVFWNGIQVLVNFGPVLNRMEVAR